MLPTDDLQGKGYFVVSWSRMEWSVEIDSGKKHRTGRVLYTCCPGKVTHLLLL